MTRPSGLVDDIRALIAQGMRNKDIAEKVGCSPSRVAQIRHERFGSSPRITDGTTVAKFRPAPVAETCQRPDARKNFATCGDPKLTTRCGETLGVCAYHFESTKPLGGTKL